MERFRTWLWLKKSFVIPTKCIFHKLTSTSRRKSKGNGHGLVSLYKDMELCGEYSDIRVMWEIIHSCPHDTTKPKRDHKRKYNISSSYWRFCFQPNL